MKLGPCFHSSIITYSLQEDVLLHTASGTPNYVAPEVPTLYFLDQIKD